LLAKGCQLLSNIWKPESGFYIQLDTGFVFVLEDSQLCRSALMGLHVQISSHVFRLCL